MESQATFDVSAAIDRRKLGGFTAGLVVVSWLVTFFDGYDMNVIAFTSKPLQTSFHLTDPMMSLVFSIGIFGTMVGGIIFGFVGDRVGRRPTIIVATGLFSLLTVALAFSQSYHQLLALRLLNGMALGGAMPLIWALNMEFAPKRYRATVITLIMLGYGFGVAAGGPIARLILPRFDWQGVFVFGGAASFLATLLLLVWLPESLRLLVLTGRQPQAAARILQRMGIEIPDGAARGTVRLVLADEGAASRKIFNPAMLFQGNLRWLTPLLWAAYFSSSISTFFLTTWGPRVLQDMHFSADHAAWLSSANSLCGMIGGTALMSFTDRHGALVIAILPIVAAPLLLVAGLAPMNLTVFLVFSIAISITLGGSHFGITSIIAMFYPSSIRANGSGWASAVAKIGSMLGPIVGGYVLAAGLKGRPIYALLAVCPAVYAVCLILIGWVERRDPGFEASMGAAEVPAAE